MPRDDDDELPLLPKKRAAAPAKAGAPTPSKGRGTLAGPLRALRAFAIVAGGLVTLVFVMGLVGFVTDNFWARFIVGLVVVVGLPALAADRVLKRFGKDSGLSVVGDVFSVVLLGLALLLVAADVVTRPVFVREGDRYARSGTTAMARIVYFLGGVSPVFPGEKPSSAPPGSASASGAPSGGPAPAPAASSAPGGK